MTRLTLPLASVALTLLAIGCSNERSAADTAAAPTASSQTTSGAQTPDPGGRVIVVEMTTDAAGVNKYSPSEIVANPGDVLRFTLGTGVHNAHFHADENPAGTSLPPAGPMLQLPGQTFDVKVAWQKGTYKFMCDPHALLGMKGQVEVN